jgi:diacylglycerol kinase family enzyme
MILFFYDKKKQMKFVLKLDAEEKKQANEWLFSLQRNVFGLTKELSKRKILFFINPYAGIKKAQEDFDTFAKPILDVAHITYETYVSKSKGDITEKMKKMNITDFDEFCAVGGDGTVHEIVQGLMARKKWENSLKKPLSVIPCGTGNG